MFECMDEPYRPGKDATQKDAAIVIIDLQEALADCKGKLVSLRDITK